MCIYICIHIYTHSKELERSCWWLCGYISIYIIQYYLYTYMHKWIIIYIHTHLSLSICIYSIHTCIYIYVCKHTNIYINICEYIVPFPWARVCYLWQLCKWPKVPTCGVACPWSKVLRYAKWKLHNDGTTHRDIMGIWTNCDLVVGFIPNQNASVNVKSCNVNQSLGPLAPSLLSQHE